VDELVRIVREMQEGVSLVLLSSAGMEEAAEAGLSLGLGM